MTGQLDRETERIRREYERRAAAIPSDFYSLCHPANLFSYQSRHRALADALRRAGLLPLSGRRILDVGCGDGQWLGMLLTLEAEEQHLAGIDLDEARLARCRDRYQRADLRLANAAGLPWPAGSFDLVLQSTVFSSVLDHSMRAAIAAEMLRVLRAGGAIVWYDFFLNNPRNPHVRGIRRREIRGLFPGCRLRLQRVTLAPPLARRLVPCSWTVAVVLETMRLFNSHYLGLIQRNA